MNLCSDLHDEVCYEGHTCPACEVRENLQAAIRSAQKEIDSLQETVASLEDDVRSLSEEKEG